jgi:hypothetical protein
MNRPGRAPGIEIQNFNPREFLARKRRSVDGWKMQFTKAKSIVILRCEARLAPSLEGGRLPGRSSFEAAFGRTSG